MSPINLNGSFYGISNSSINRSLARDRQTDRRTARVQQLTRPPGEGCIIRNYSDIRWCLDEVNHDSGHVSQPEHGHL